MNAKYPEGAAVPTVPANLLLNLPPLPEPLRISESSASICSCSMTDADVIVDYALNIIR